MKNKSRDRVLKQFNKAVMRMWPLFCEGAGAGAGGAHEAETFAQRQARKAQAKALVGQKRVLDAFMPSTADAKEWVSDPDAQMFAPFSIRETSYDIISSRGTRQ